MVIGEMVASRENEASGISAFSLYIKRLLSALSLNLHQKGAQYEEPEREKVEEI